MAAPIPSFSSAQSGGLYNETNQGTRSTWTTPANGVPTRTVRLNPTLEKAQGRQDTTFGNAVNKSSGILSNPTLNWKGIPKMTVNPGMTGQNAIMSRLGPQIGRERDALHGIGLDTEAHRQGISDQQATINTPLNALNTMGGQTSSNMSVGSGTKSNDQLAAMLAQYNANTNRSNSSQQNTMDWLNLGVQGAKAIPAVTDWASGIDWGSIFGT